MTLWRPPTRPMEPANSPIEVTDAQGNVLRTVAPVRTLAETSRRWPLASRRLPGVQPPGGGFKNKAAPQPWPGVERETGQGRRCRVCGKGGHNARSHKA